MTFTFYLVDNFRIDSCKIDWCGYNTVKIVENLSLICSCVFPSDVSHFDPKGIQLSRTDIHFS